MPTPPRGQANGRRSLVDPGDATPNPHGDPLRSFEGRPLPHRHHHGCVRYAANHGGIAFTRPIRLPFYDSSIADNATTVIRVRAEAAHKACLDDCSSYEAAERGAAKFLHNIIDEVWYNNLKDANTFYTKVSALDIISFLDANSGELHAIDMIALRTNIHQYYVQADGIPQYIIMLEDAQKKATRAGMPIADIELVMMALAAVLTAQHFPREVDDWEGLSSKARTWVAWKTAFRLTHLKRQRQILASGPASPTKRPCWTLHRPAKEWQQGMLG